MEPTAVVDTNIVIDLIKGTINKKKIKSLARTIYITAPTRYELLAGAKSEETKQKIMAIPCIPLSCGAAEIAGQIQQNLYDKGRPMGGLDVLIAAICIEKDIPLVTRDKAFGRLEEHGLRTIPV